MGVVIAHTASSTIGTNHTVCGPIDTTGANAIYIFGYSVFAGGNVGDNVGNTYTLIGDPDSTCNGGLISVRAFDPIVSTSHTFHFDGNSTFENQIAVVAFQVQDPGGSFLNTRNGRQVNPVQSSSTILPPSNNAVFVSAVVGGCGWGPAGLSFPTVDEGFTILEAQNRLAVAYLSQDTAAAINPTWITLNTRTDVPNPTGATTLECMGFFIPFSGGWQVYEA
jgi:hypothetical protein